MRRSGNAVLGNAVIGLAVFGHAVIASCAPASRYEEPSALRGYEILITRHDSLGRDLAQGLTRRGFTVRDRVRGGGRATAYLFAFTFLETDPPGAGVTWLHVRLADTRTGAIVAAVSLPLDSLGGPVAGYAGAIVDSLAASAALRREPSPP
ncbi:MAG TPA: hypothetical protein VH137_07195 [Gemmatimonadales bacterium]|nr:hypothetical protein [Gemmatimonadales bacterium]